MTAESQDLAELLQSDSEFHRLSDTHHDIEHRLHELSSKPYLTASEEVEESTLKKRKLSLKDQMEAIRRQRRHPTPPPVSQTVRPQPQG